MKTRLQCVGLALVVAVSTAAARDGSGGYLATVGPAALRFHALSSPVLMLPPLDSGDKPLASLISEPPSSKGVDAKTQPLPPVTEMTGAKSGKIPEITANSSDPQAMASTAPVGPDSGGDSAITAQMFLRFFTQATNSSQNSIVVMPLSFAPAQPAVRLSSSAKYSSTKR